MAIRKKVPGPDHPDWRTFRCWPAPLDGQGKHAESEPLYREVLAVFERRYGPEHYEVAVNLNNLAANYHQQSRLADAGPLYRRCTLSRRSCWKPTIRTWR